LLSAQAGILSAHPLQRRSSRHSALGTVGLAKRFVLRVTGPTLGRDVPRAPSGPRHRNFFKTKKITGPRTRQCSPHRLLVTAAAATTRAARQHHHHHHNNNNNHCHHHATTTKAARHRSAAHHHYHYHHPAAVATTYGRN
jgi:hypothetical protein